MPSNTLLFSLSSVSELRHSILTDSNLNFCLKVIILNSNKNNHARKSESDIVSPGPIIPSISKTPRLLRPDPLTRLSRRRQVVYGATHPCGFPFPSFLRPPFPGFLLQQGLRHVQIVLCLRQKGRPERKSTDKRWSDVIEEEDGFYHYEERKKAKRSQFLIAVTGSVLAFSVFCLILWGASRRFKPEINVKKMIVHNFYIGQGTDLTGIPTKLFTINCSVKMNVYNPATFFGIHVSSMPVNLMYSELAVATGELKYYQRRRSHHFLSVNLQGVKVPLYGAGASLAMSNDTGGGQ